MDDVQKRSRLRKRTAISLSPDLFDWAKGEAETNPTYRNFSHLVEVALNKLRTQEKGRATSRHES